MNQRVVQIKAPSHEILDATQVAIRGLFLLMRNVSLHGPSHPASVDAAEQAQKAIEDAGPPFAIEFVEQASFRDRNLIPMDVDTFHKVQQLTRAFNNLSTQEILFEGAVPVEALVYLGSALSQGAKGPSSMLQERRLEGIIIRDISDARMMIESEEVDPEVFVLTHFTLALASSQRLVNDRSDVWSWVIGVAVIRRLERCVEMSRFATVKILETAPGDWGVARRAIAAALDVLLVLKMLGVASSTRRAVAHATLAVSIQGLEDRAGQKVDTAARDLLGRMLDARKISRSGVEPHRLRTTAVVSSLTAAGDGSEIRSGLGRLIALAYSLARYRCPPNVSFELGRCDLLAMAVRQTAGTPDSRWVNALIMSAGTIPPGAVVRLSDGRTGLVVEPGSPDDPWKPTVYVDGRIEPAASAVRLLTRVNPPAGG